MQPDRWKQVEQLFEAAQAQPAEERARFLEQACPHDGGLRAEVLSLLRADAGPDSFLDGGALPAVEARPALESGQRVGNYEIVELIGRGGMGEVYRARDPRLKRDVAVKVLPAELSGDAERLRRFEQEALAAGRLNHPNILTVHDVGVHAGAPYLVSELLEGETLQARLAAGPLPPRKALEFAQQVAGGLAAAHQKGIVHRDLKPANLFVTSDGRVKILDFGLAKLTRQEGGGEILTTLTGTGPGVVFGTAGYLSPEQARGLKADSRSDIFSFGVVLHEMLTGQRAFAGESVAELLSAVLREDPPEVSKLNPALPPGLSRVVRHCLEKRAEDRFESARDLAFALEAVSEAPPAVIEAQIVRKKPWSRTRAAWLAAGAVAIGLGLGIATGIRLSGPAEPRQRVQYQIHPPPGILTDVRLSPDGRYLAFLNLTGSRSGRVWLRALDSLEARSLTDDGANYGVLMWSPDSEFLAVRAGRKLVRIPRGGGPPVAMGEVPELTMGGVWLDTGDILVSTEEGMLRFPPGGKAAVKTGWKGMIRPSALPGGRFLYAQLVGDFDEGKAEGIFVGFLDGRPPVQLLKDGSYPMYVEPALPGAKGGLLFVRGESLVAQPFDAGSLALSSETATVVERLPSPSVVENRRALTASRSGVLLFRAKEVSNTRQLAWLDRAGKVRELVTEPFAPAPNSAPRLSPDGTKAILSLYGPQGIDLWLADLLRRSMARLTFGGASSGVWSPDGRRILWAAFDGKRYVRALDGTGQDQLVHEDGECPSCYVMDWSRDGNLFAVATYNQKQRLGTSVRRLAGGGEISRYTGAGWGKAWSQFSPNGRWLAYVDFTDMGRSDIIVESVPAGSQHWHLSPNGGDWPMWCGDGKELFYMEENRMMSVEVRESGSLLEFGTPLKLFELKHGHARFQVSRDGQRFLVVLPEESSADQRALTVDTDWRARLAR